MPTKVRIATFNLENLEDNADLSTRISLMRPQLVRINADILCLQEVNKETALDKLIQGTLYENFNRISTANNVGANHNQAQNIVILSRWEIIDHEFVLNKFVQPPSYQMLTAIPSATASQPFNWTRAIVHAQIALPDRVLHVLSFHLKSKLPFNIPGQRENIPNTQVKRWKSSAAWAEGAFISSMIRMGQALEVRTLVDKIFTEEPEALLTVCGDFNSESDEVPVEAIRGDVENTENPDLARQVLAVCEKTIPTSSRYSLIYQGRGTMLDHLLISRSLLAFYRLTEIHNELLHDESAAFATDKKFPESDHAPVVSEFVMP
jgi:endonuclease/exonuclease/phosphatase family metal-dependent hydrolase